MSVLDVGLLSVGPQSDLIVRSVRTVPRASARLVWFPYAGGAASRFRELSLKFPSWIECLAVEYPGRGRRIHEPLVDNLEVLGLEIARSCEAYLDRPLIFFGHSMGGLVAYETCRSLKRLTGETPAMLIVSATRAPSLPNRFSLDGLDREDIIGGLQVLNGTDPELLIDQEFMEFAVTAYRSDVAACERYVSNDLEPFEMRIGIYGGLGDPFVLRAELEAWRALATKPASIRLFPGDHFYLHAQDQLVSEAILRDVAAVVPLE